MPLYALFLLRRGDKNGVQVPLDGIQNLTNVTTSEV